MGTLSVQHLAQELARGHIEPLYIIVGESLTERERAFQLLVEATVEPGERDLSVNVFDGDQTDGAQILEALLTVPFLGGNRLVYVRRFDHMAAEQQELIADACAKGFSGAVLVLAAGSLDRRRRATQRLLELGTLVQCGEPTGEDRIRWLVSQAEELGFSLRPEAAALLAQQGGFRLDALHSELQKIAAYVGAGAEATEEDVIAVMAASGPWVEEGEIFQLCDAAAEGRAAAALDALDRLLGTGAHPSYVLTMLARHFRQLLAVNSLGRRHAASVAKQLGLRAPRMAIERMQRQAACFSQEELEERLFLLLETDLSLKRGAVARPLLERALLALAPGRRQSFAPK